MQRKTYSLGRLPRSIFLSALAAIATFTSAVEADLKILPVGDSITRGINGLQGEGRISYRKEFESRLDASGCLQTMLGSQNNSSPGHLSSHEGYSGHRVDHFQLGLGSNPGIATIMADNSEAEVVLVHLGTNDMLQSQSVAGTLVELNDVISIINPSPTRAVYLANVVPWYDVDSNADGILDIPNANAEALSAQITATFANEPYIHLVDVRTGFRPTDMFPDGIHPSQDDDNDPRSDSGEHHIAVAFAAALEVEGDCVPPTNSDSSFPLTNILSPVTGEVVSGPVTFSGRATDTGGAGFDRVRLAILDGKRDDFPANCSGCTWWDFTSEQFGSFDSIDAYKVQQSTNYLEWRAGVSGDPGDAGDPINLPAGVYTVFAIAIDNDGNQNFFNSESWPERTLFTVTASGNFCNGLAVNVDLASGDSPTSGDDVILGTSGADIINALGGNDTICSLGGNDVINAGGGNDWIDSGAGNDDIQGNAGTDTIFGGLGNDLIRGGVDDDHLEGEEGDDRLFGQGGDDFLGGGSGVDDLKGGSGNDMILTGTGATVGSGVFVSGGGGNDTIFGGSDADDIRGAAGLDTLSGAGGNDVITGGNGRDTIDGGIGNDDIRGQGSPDIIEGGSGTDTIFGGDGNDVVNGGDGADTILGGAGNDTLDGGGGSDVISGGLGDDALIGGASVGDVCDGQGGSDTADASCESIVGVP